MSEPPRSPEVNVGAKDTRGAGGNGRLFRRAFALAMPAAITELRGRRGTRMSRPRRRRRSLFSQTPDLVSRYTVSANAVVPPTAHARARVRRSTALRTGRRVAHTKGSTVPVAPANQEQELAASDLQLRAHCVATWCCPCQHDGTMRQGRCRCDAVMAGWGREGVAEGRGAGPENVPWRPRGDDGRDVRRPGEEPRARE